MLINCRECGHRVSDVAPTCPSCGTPVAREVTMLESYSAGIVAGFLTIVSIPVCFVGICWIFSGEDGAGLGWILIIAASLVHGWGQYLRYCSSHTVRTARR